MTMTTGDPRSPTLNIPGKRTVKILAVLSTLGIISLIVLTSGQIGPFVYSPRPVPSPGAVSSDYSVPDMFSDDVVVVPSKVRVLSISGSRDHSPPCRPVLERASYGRWVERSDITPGERTAIDRFLVTVRGYEKLPVSVQRKDNRCGNVNMAEKGRPGGLSWYRALCNPLGPNSCCYSNHKCVNLTVAECQCAGCQDLRQQIHAELSTWMPHDPSCQLRVYKDESDICPLLKNFTIQVLGDSFMRQVFISLLGTLRSRYPDGVITGPDISRERIEHCDTYLRYFSKCSDVIPLNSLECGGTVRFVRESRWRASQISKILAVFKSYVGKPNSFIIFGLGIHDMYHPDVIIEKILKPVLAVVKKSPPWPHLIWVAPQSPGLLKTPLVKQQQASSVARFNSVVTPFLKSEGIPVLDGFNLTRDSLMSYDGTHYGKGLNDLKAQILLNYFSEIRERL